MCVGFVTVEVEPSPKFQIYEPALMELLVNTAICGLQPNVSVVAAIAVGDKSTCICCVVLSEHPLELVVINVTV